MRNGKLVMGFAQTPCYASVETKIALSGVRIS